MGIEDINRSLSKLQEIPIQNVRKQYDVNNDGVFDAAEQAAWKRDRALATQKARPQFDVNGDGKIDQSEWAAARAWMLKQQSPVKADASKPHLSATERQKAIERYNRELIKRHDKDGNGALDQEEKDALWADWRAQIRARKMQGSEDTTNRVPAVSPNAP